VFDLENPSFDKRLLVLGGFVLGILDELTVLHGFMQPVSDFLALDLPQVLKLIFEFLAALLCEINSLTRHLSHLPAPTAKRRTLRVGPL
jgi:hypothetical protein